MADDETPMNAPGPAGARGGASIERALAQRERAHALIESLLTASEQSARRVLTDALGPYAAAVIEGGAIPVDDDDRSAIARLVQRSARAVLERGLGDAARRVRESALLARASTVFAESLDLDATLARVVEVVLPELGDFGFLDVEYGPENVRRIPLALGDPRRQAILETTRWVRSTRTDMNLCALSSAASGIHVGIDEAWLQKVAGSPEHLALMKDLAFTSMITVPLVTQGRVLGALTLFFGDSGREHDADHVRLAEDVAARAALAIENARLVQDLTAREEEAQRAMAAAREADRRKDEFLAMLGHELRNPLAPIATAVELMKLSQPRVHEAERVVIERQVRHLVRLVDDLLDVSRITRGKTELGIRAVEAHEVAAQAVEQASPLLERYRHRFVQRVAARGLPLRVDPHRIAQVLANLLTNAAKYTPPGGLVELTAERDQSWVVLRVSDTGRGIDAALLPRVFDLFTQGDRALDRSEGGLGLGLAIARSLVELHGGTIEAHSAGAGRGSTFSVRLPCIEDEPTTIEPPPPPLESAGRSLRVLVVDDNRDAAELLADALAIDGHVTAVAFDGPSALESAGRLQPDVVLLDIGLPLMDGYQVAAKLRASPPTPELRLFAISGYGQEQDRRRSREAGFDEHLVKPVDLTTIRRLIRGS